MSESNPSGPWVVVANVVRERPYGPLGIEKRNGSKHFFGGAKVYLIDAYGGMCANVTVIGRHRGSRRYAKLAMPVVHLERFRTRVLYSPTVLRLISEHFEHRIREHDRASAEERAATYEAWKREDSGHPFERHVRVALHRPRGVTHLVASDPSIAWVCDVPTTFLPEDLRPVGTTFVLRRDHSGAVSIERPLIR